VLTIAGVGVFGGTDIGCRVNMGPNGRIVLNDVQER
jgi:hypothetical protein